MHRATLADHEADLRQFVALLIDHGRYLEARDAMRVLREEELHDFTRRSRQRAASSRGSALALNPHEREFEKALEPLAARMRAEQTLADARVKPGSFETRTMGWLDDPVSEAMLAQAEGELRALLASISPREQPVASEALCDPSESATSLRRCQPGAPVDSAGHQALPPAGVAHLRYFVRDQHLDILLTTARGWHRHSVPIARTELHRRVHAWRAVLLNPAADTQRGAREFHALMIAPMLPQLAGVRELQVSLDGALRYLPLAALHDGHRYLVQRFGLVMDDGIQARHDLGNTSSAAREPTRAKGSPLHLAAFGRTAPDPDHAALPGVDAELKAIAALGGSQRPPRSSIRVLQDQAFTAQALQETLALSPGVVHIASHFHLAAAEEESSYLLLGDGQRLPLARLAQMPWKQVRLVLLSACDSAVSESSRQGREFDGLAGVLRQAGVGSVLASLWPIADASTASFMGEFYRPWATTGAGRSGADLDARWLAQAQRRWLARHPTGAYAHPYHWAGFVWWETARGTRTTR
jgi:CHAT domain-containing protein